MYGFAYEYKDENGEMVEESFHSDDVTEAVDAACVTAKLTGERVVVVAPDYIVHCLPGSGALLIAAGVLAVYPIGKATGSGADELKLYRAIVEMRHLLAARA
mgnify:CR=1 FL=1|tara:strand:- start:679 stop:984 length:306 start_codon:yes stop_codon:yes gene_type:complete